MRKFIHYRSKCVTDFSVSKEGSINLDKYSKKFSSPITLNKISVIYSDLIKNNDGSPESLENISQIIRKMQYATEKALFPYRYTTYEVGVFGSARVKSCDKEFQEVRQMVKDIVSNVPAGVITGGGPAIMEAANKGLQEGRIPFKKNGNDIIGKNTGLTVDLPFEEITNDHLDIEDKHGTFGTRLNSFFDRMNLMISWDGGGGTDLENSFGFQLKQVGHLENDFPLILKRSAWEKIQEIKFKQLYEKRISEDKIPLISPNARDLFHFVDHPDEVVDAVIKHYKEKWEKNCYSKLDDKSKEQKIQKT